MTFQFSKWQPAPQIQTIVVVLETAKVRQLGLLLTTSQKAKVFLKSTKFHTLSITVSKANVICLSLGGGYDPKFKFLDLSDLERTTISTY